MQRQMSPEKYFRLKRRGIRNAIRVRRALGRPLQHYVFEILKLAQETGAPIANVKESSPFSSSDLRGWDIVVIDREGALHGFEVKSSESGADKFRRRGAAKGFHTPVIVPRLNDTPQQILDKIGHVMPFLRGFKLEKRETI